MVLKYIRKNPMSILISTGVQVTLSFHFRHCKFLWWSEVSTTKDGSSLNIEISIKDDNTCYPREKTIHVIAFQMTNEKNDFQLKRQIKAVIHDMVVSDKEREKNIFLKTINISKRSVSFEGLDKSAVFRIVILRYDTNNGVTNFLMISRNSYGGTCHQISYVTLNNSIL